MKYKKLNKCEREAVKRNVKGQLTLAIGFLGLFALLVGFMFGVEALYNLLSPDVAAILDSIAGYIGWILIVGAIIVVIVVNVVVTRNEAREECWWSGSGE